MNKSFQTFLFLVSSAALISSCGPQTSHLLFTDTSHPLAPVSFDSASCVPLASADGTPNHIFFSAQDAFESSHFIMAGSLPYENEDLNLISLAHLFSGSVSEAQKSGHFGSVSVSRSAVMPLDPPMTVLAHEDGLLVFRSRPTVSYLNSTQNKFKLANTSGYVLLNRNRITTLLETPRTFYYGPYVVYAQNCVSGMAISLHVEPSSSAGPASYSGRVYLFLNGQQHGVYMEF